MSSKIIHYGWIHPEEENPRVPDGMYLVVLRRNRTMVRLAEYRFRCWVVCDGNYGLVNDVIWYTPLPKSPEVSVNG